MKNADYNLAVKENLAQTYLLLSSTKKSNWKKAIELSEALFKIDRRQGNIINSINDIYG